MTRLPRKVIVENGAVKELGRLTPTCLDLTMNLIPLHRATAVLAESDLPLRMHDLVEVYNQNGSAGIFRVANIAETKRRERKYSLNHGLDILSDSSFECIETFSGTVAGFLARIIAAQTQKVNGVAYWALGTVEDTNPWNKDIEYDNLMECLTDIARTEEDYMFTFDMSGFPWVLNFVARDSAVLSEFRLRHNTENCQIAQDDGDLCTRLHLSVTEETSSTVGSQTVISTQEGYYTYDDAAAQAIYGIVVKTAGVYRKDVPTAAALQAWVDAYFSRHHAPAVQISIDGEELVQHTGCAIDEVHLGRICRVALPDYNEIFNERVVSVQYPDVLRQPRRVKVSLANKRETAEGAFAKIRESARKAGGAARKAQTTAEKNEVELIRQHADIEKYGGWLRLWASEEEWDEVGERYVATGATQLSIESDAITGLAAGAGVQLDEAGRPVVDAHGNPVFIEDSAVTFSVGTYYAKGTYVRHEGTVYQLTAAHNPGTTWENTSKKAVPDSVYSKAIQNADAIRLEVTNRQNGDDTLQGLIQVEAGKISQIVSAVGSNGEVTAASIVLAINGAGSSALIKADQIQITGNTTLSGTMEIDGDGVLRVKKNLIVNGNNGRQISMNNGTISTNDLSVKSGGALTFVGTATGEHYDLSVSTFPNFIRNAQVSGNTLQLWKVTDSDASPSITFSKAVSLSGGWNGSGTYTVSATSGSISGTVPSTTPILVLNGSGTADNFTAELWDDMHTAQQKAVYGYLGQGSGSVKVYKTRSGSTLSDPIATISITQRTPVWSPTPGSSSVTSTASYRVTDSAGASVSQNLLLSRSGNILGLYRTSAASANLLAKVDMSGYLDTAQTVSASTSDVLVEPASGKLGLPSVTVSAVTQGTPIWTPTPGSATGTTTTFEVTDSAGATVSQNLLLSRNGNSVGLYKTTAASNNLLAQVDMTNYIDAAQTVSASTSDVLVEPTSGKIGLASVTVSAVTQGTPSWSPTPGSGDYNTTATVTVTDSAGASASQVLRLADGGDGYVYLCKTSAAPANRVARIDISGAASGVDLDAYALSAVTGSAYDSSEGFWFGDTTLSYTLSNGVTGTAQCVVNVQDAVNAGVGAAWNAAYGQVSWPGAGSAASFAVSGPGATVYTGQTKTFTLTSSGGYVYCSDGTNNVARISAGGGSYSFSCASTAETYVDSIGGYLNCGAISKSGLIALTYLRFRIKCDSSYKWCYITVNA